MAQELFCFKKDCFWSEVKVKDRRAYVKEQNQQHGANLVEEYPLFSFYKSKSKQLKNYKQKCTELSETLCQMHYFQKKIEGEGCKSCLEEHDYEQQQPRMIKMYEDKKRKISNKDNRHDRLYDYLSAYLEYELQDSAQYKELDKIINKMQTQMIDSRVFAPTIPKQDLFTLEQVFKIDNLPNVQIIQQVEEQRRDHLITQSASGYEKKISTDKGINLLLKRYPINK